MKRAVIALALVTVTGCTRAELAAWQVWYAQDPDAAVAYAVEHADDIPASRYGVAVWDEIARCESGGRWDYPPVTNRSGTYSGGLMIGHRWWPRFGGLEFASYPYQATKAEQIVVAERIADEAGLDAAWQCWP